MKPLLNALALSAPLLLAPVTGHAVVIGFLGNFDVINDTGSTAHGFEIELEGLHASDISDTFGGANRGFPSGRGFDPATSVQRYGAPTITEYSNGASFGTRVTYMGLWNGSAWDYGTPSGSFITPGDNCWSGGGVGYGPSTPCDHFGVGTTTNATRTTYSWLLETATPGALSNGVVTLPAPAWQVIPPAPPAPGQVAAPPVVVAQIQAPKPEVESQFGEAIWVKVFATELEDGIQLEDLVGGAAKMAQLETEVEWQLLQTDPGNPLAGQLESGLGAPVGPKAASIIRRYEFFRYAGEYDPETHEALVSSDSNPLPEEIGTYLGAQNGAANLNVVALVPEPHTWALMLGGLVLAGARLRRRRAD
ncbi:PEP-CTERM putative exosortase interaction domain-containing protein [Burkholderiales bacterium JOSHI_001]|nr:PEP-CTERM putative exosortase interaction domain-containing protein [Burkholderiales bacterium JOSHI_001]